jgi:hypothetical protein
MSETLTPATTRRGRAVGLKWPRAVTWLALLLPVFAWAALTYPGYLELHSGFRPIFNLTDLGRSLPGFGWAPTVGQPYDLLRGEGALTYWLALLPRALSASSVFAIKWVLGASFVMGAVGMYGWARRSLGDWPGLLAALVYVLWPIGLATVYVRGALAEAVFLALMPWILWAADVAVESGRGRPAIVLAIGLAAAFWTQAGLALWLAAIVLLEIVLRARARTNAEKRGEKTGDEPGASRRSARSALLGWLGGLAFGIIGLLPVIARHGVVGKTYVDFADHFVYPHQLLQAGWGAGSSIAGPYDTLTFQLGLVACGLAVIGLTIADFGLRIRRVPNGQSAVRNPSSGVFALGIIGVLVLLSTALSAPLWRLLPFVAWTLTYPWQLLLLAGPWLAWLAGFGGRALLDRLPAEQRESAAMPLVAALLTLTLLGSASYLNPTPINAPVPDAPLAVFGDNEIALLDAEAIDTLRPGTEVSISARWQALRPLDRDYTIFFHVVSPDGQVLGQHDTMPQDNKLPTSQWRSGQVVDDRYRAALKPGAPPAADLRYNLGLYQWQTGQRLRTATDDKVMVTP